MHTIWHYRFGVWMVSRVLGVRGWRCRPGADDWTQWRGPDRSDISHEKGTLKEWPEEGPKQLWLFKDAGLGYSGFAVVGDTLYTMGSRDDIECLIALNVGRRHGEMGRRRSVRGWKTTGATARATRPRSTATSSIA